MARTWRSASTTCASGCLSERIARELGNAIVAPVIAYVPEGSVNPPTGHMRYPGTITVPPDVSAACSSPPRAASSSPASATSCSSATRATTRRTTRRSRRSSARSGRVRRSRVHAIGEYYRAATSEFSDALRQRGFSDAEIGPHAGLADTSLMLAVDPSLVRADRRRSREERGRDRRPAARECASSVKARLDAIVAAHRGGHPQAATHARYEPSSGRSREVRDVRHCHVSPALALSLAALAQAPAQAPAQRRRSRTVPGHAARRRRREPLQRDRRGQAAPGGGQRPAARLRAARPVATTST